MRPSPVEATQRGAVTGAGGELYLQHVSLSPLKLRATVAMGATFVADPKRELLEVIERLLPMFAARAVCDFEVVP